MTLGSLLALFCAMTVLAAIPSLSVLAVSTRSASAGLMHGVFTAIGIVLGDVIFILIAILGLSLLSETLGSLYFVMKYLGGAYLIWLGLGIWKTNADPLEPENHANKVPASVLSSFLTGLLITLADQKATVFYLGFFPAFLDIAHISSLDILMILGTTIVSVGGVKLIYACMADRARWLMGSKIRARLNRVAAGVMIAVGLFLMIR